MEQKDSWLEHPHVPALIADHFVLLLIKNIPINRHYKASLKPSQRAKLIAQAEQEMLDHLEKPLTLKQLAKGLGSSSSALSYGFQDLFGMSPMRYLKVQRLNAVRRCLKASSRRAGVVETPMRGTSGSRGSNVPIVTIGIA
ncbi:hypothetical protein [Coleofasciculus sp. F4-SAH-05]|uniref:hypothetical protein n=1 Tax=Coleofasciculus sp. F4-SAH-05 TaxID=3069525 RepID=UPI0032F89BDB